MSLIIYLFFLGFMTWSRVFQIQKKKRLGLVFVCTYSTSYMTRGPEMDCVEESK